LQPKCTVKWSDFEAVKTAIEMHIAEDDVKWQMFEELRKEVKAIGNKVLWCSGAIAMLMFLNANHVLDLRPLFERDAEATEVPYGR
jgi:hypothetical protein